MKTRLTSILISMTCLLGFATPGYADPGNYEWGADAKGDYIRLYDKEHRPLRVYLSKNEIDKRIQPEIQINYRVDAVQPNTEVKKEVDELSPYGPREQFLFYYNRHTPQEKVIYEKIFNAAKNIQKEVDLGPNIDEDRLTTIFYSVIRDHPEIFWLDWYQGKYKSKNYHMIFKYYDYVNEVPEIQKIIDDETKIIIKNANQYSNIYEKVRYVYEYIALNAPYKTGENCVKTIYQFFIHRTANCVVNTLVFQYLLNQLGIPARYVIGDDDTHTWNQVILNGTCYNFDVTGAYISSFVSSTNETIQKVIDYDFFGISDNEIRNVHNSFEQDYDQNALIFPACNGHIDYKTVFKNSMVSYFYKEILGMNEKYNVAHSLQDYFNIMHHALSSTHSNSIATYIIVVGTALKDKIYSLTYNDFKNGYLGDILENYKKGYTFNGSKSKIEIADGVFLIRKEDNFE